MAAWVVSVLLLAVSGTAVLGYPEATFIEDLEITPNSGASRIVSGWEAQEGQFPFQISLRMVNAIGGVSSCGGSIIGEEWGITAAHCTAGRVTMVIRAGLVNLTRPTYLFETTEYYNHPLYNENIPSVVQTHDIGVVKFPRRLVFNDLVKPIRLHNSADKNRNYDGVRLVASGWGRTWTNGPAPENLNWVFLLGNTNQLCTLFYPSIAREQTICASHYNVTSQSTCSGDSGGPLTVVDDDGELSMVGVASFVSGQGCHSNTPAGFVRPGHYHDWYLEVTGVDFDWQPASSESEPDSSDESKSESNSESSSESNSESSNESSNQSSDEPSNESSDEKSDEPSDESD